jgi:lysyl-tRNA synthetase class 2
MSVGDFDLSVIHVGRGPLLFLLIGLLAAFFLVRLSTRLQRANVRWWFGSLKPRGVHVHHMVPGIVVMVGAGILQFALQPTGRLLDILALVFGIGIALVLDEFALVLHLEDVYWSEEGRTSIDAVVLAATFTGLLLIGLVPQGFPGGLGLDRAAAGWMLWASAAFNLVPVIVTLLKGKLWTGLVGIFIPGVALIAAVRLAKPRSPWAHRHYLNDPEKLRQARLRDARLAQHKRRLFDLVAGAPSRLPRELGHVRLSRDLGQPAFVRETAQPQYVSEPAIQDRVD